MRVTATHKYGALSRHSFTRAEDCQAATLTQYS
jgi:hypothetical protein